MTTYSGIQLVIPYSFVLVTLRFSKSVSQNSILSPEELLLIPILADQFLILSILFQNDVT